jgi:ATP-dependent DNA helicase RecG
MPEQQNIEWKESWRDEWLEWICGYANAQGGTIFIGKDDTGKVAGLKRTKKLMEDIPNKVKSAMNIVVDVNLHEEDGERYIEIVVPKYPSPVLCKGILFYRSGATLQRLTGSDLERFVMMRRGWQWDKTPVPDVKVSDLDANAIRIFKDAAKKAKRLDEEVFDYTDEELLDKLGLIDNGFLTIAAVLLFHAQPEKWVVGAYSKVAYFESDAEILYQDVVSGPLIEQPDKTVDLIYSKYLRALISYEGIRRIEDFPYPRPALREAVLNAITNKHYEKGAPVQIRVYDDHLILFNDGQLPENWTVDTLFVPHKSVPYNPLIANTYYYAGFIESWGRGIEKIVKSCNEEGIPLPEFDVATGDIKLTFTTIPERVIHVTRKNSGSITNTDLGHPEGQDVLDNVRDKRQANYGLILTNIQRNPSITTTELAEALGVSDRQVRRLIKELKDLSVLVRKGSDRSGSWIIR